MDASKIDLSPVTTEDFSGENTSEYFNFASPKYANSKTGLVYGTIQITLLDKLGNVDLGGSGNLLDNYSFETHKGCHFRNFATKIGKGFASYGIPYDIY